MDTKEILKKAALLKRNPELANVIPNSEIISLVNDVLGAFSKLQTVIEQNKLKGDKGEDGVTPVAGKDYPSFDQIDDVLSSALRDYGEKYGKLQTELQAQIERASKLENGKDAEITEELIAQVAELAASLIDLPDFETLVGTEINRNSEAIRNALELLQGDERLDASAIKGLDAYIKTTYVNGGTIGKGQVYGFIRQAVADGTIPTPQLAISDLTDVKKSAVAPPSPAVGDLWIDIS
jgi:Arc/MetJ-type ribon-helix-helix transcriptional regulator